MKKFIINFLILISVIFNLTSCSKKKCVCPTQFYSYSYSYGKVSPYKDIEKALIQRQFNNKELPSEQINICRNNIEYIEFLCAGEDYSNVTIVIIYKYHTCK